MKTKLIRIQIDAVTDEQARSVPCPNESCKWSPYSDRRCAKWLNQSVGWVEVPTHHNRKKRYLQWQQQKP